LIGEHEETVRGQQGSELARGCVWWLMRWSGDEDKRMGEMEVKIRESEVVVSS